MKPKQQRIAIAEACGWRHTPKELNPHLWYNETYHKNTPEIIYSARNSNCLPDYLNDLNAMHEAEKTLPTNSFVGWVKNMSDIAKRDGTYVSRATAAQRAEAFLRTINKWTDS